MKFRKKPIVIEAVQFIWPARGLPEGVHTWAEEKDATPRDMSIGYVQTAGGKAHVWAGDWIIREPDGRGFCPCRPDIFDATYELLEEGATQ